MAEIYPHETLESSKYGIYISTHDTIYVCPKVAKLIETDREIMRENLKVIIMPDAFSNLHQFIEHLKEKGFKLS